MKRFNYRQCRWLGWMIATLLAAFLVAGLPVRSVAQISLPSPAASQDSSKPPLGVQRYGAIEVAAISFEGEELFKVVAPTVRDRKSLGNLTPVEIRAEEVKANLKRVIAEDLPEEVQKKRGYKTNFDPKTLEVFPTTLNRQTTIVAKDAYRFQLQDLVSVSNLDASYAGVTVDELAGRWQKILYQKLSQELEKRSPETFEKNIETAVYIGAGTIGISLLLWLFQRLLHLRDKALKARLVSEPIVSPSQALITSHLEPLNESTSPQPIPLDALQQQLRLKRRRHLVAALKWLPGLGQLAAWLFGIALILNLFPQSSQVGAALLDVPIRLVGIWFITSVLNWAGDVLLDRLSRAWEDDQFSAFLFASEDAQRKTLRIATTMKALRGLKTFLVVCFGIGWALQVVGVSIASVLAGGAVVAFAITFAFQSLVKDLINGCLILWEDQYGIGDVVAIGGSTGLVENMNLRVTQLRDAEGRLITIPNSSITKVENLTRTWSRVNFEIEIDYGTNVNEALAAIRQVAEQLHTEPEWRDCIVDPPEVLGIDQLSHSGTLIRVWIKTKPAQQWAVGREFRRRVWCTLHEYGIHIGAPHQAIRAEVGNYSLQSTPNGQNSALDGDEHIPLSAPQPSNPA